MPAWFSPARLPRASSTTATASAPWTASTTAGCRPPSTCSSRTGGPPSSTPGPRTRCRMCSPRCRREGIAPAQVDYVDPHARAPGPRGRRRAADGALPECAAHGAPAWCAAHDRSRAVCSRRQSRSTARRRRGASTAKSCRCARERVIETPEGATLRLAGRELLFLDAPGHARHHVVVRDGEDRPYLRRRHLRPVLPRARPGRPAVLLSDHQPVAVRPAGAAPLHRPDARRSGPGPST